MNPLIKWPGGKSSEIKQIKHLIPEFNRYVEIFLFKAPKRRNKRYI